MRPTTIAPVASAIPVITPVTALLNSGSINPHNTKDRGKVIKRNKTKLIHPGISLQRLNAKRLMIKTIGFLLLGAISSLQIAYVSVNAIPAMIRMDRVGTVLNINFNPS